MQVILNVDDSKAYIQNADTNAYLENRFATIDVSGPISEHNADPAAHADIRETLNGAIELVGRELDGKANVNHTHTAGDVGAYSKDETLSNTTKTKFGLGADAVPDDVLSLFGSYRQHWWARRRIVTNYRAVTLTSDAGWLHLYGNPTRKITYGTSVTATASGITIKNPSTVTISGYSTAYNSTLKGKYITGFSYNGSSSISNDVVFVDSNATFNTNENLYIKSGAHPVDSVPYETYGAWEYVQSSNRNAYPDSGIANDYETRYLGIPFDNAVNASKVEIGNYVGVGSVGEANANSITFGFAPKLFLIMTGVWGHYSPYASSEGTQKTYVLFDELTTSYVSGVFGYTYGNNLTYAKKSSDGKTIYFYGNGTTNHYNTQNTKYYYMAIG